VLVRDLKLGTVSRVAIRARLTWLRSCGELAVVNKRRTRMALSKDQEHLSAVVGPGDGEASVVSLRAEVPAALLASMQTFIERHPNWDQYRLVQAAVAGFLVQNGSRSRGVTRCYLANLFPAQRGFNADAAAGRSPS
jgi:hypothetical protein